MPHQKQFNILTIKDIGSLTPSAGVTIKDIGSLTPSAGELKARRLYRNRLSITGAKLLFFLELTKLKGTKIHII